MVHLGRAENFRNLGVGPCDGRPNPCRALPATGPDATRSLQGVFRRRSVSSLPNTSADDASAASFPASDPPSASEGITGRGEPDPSSTQSLPLHNNPSDRSQRARASVPVVMDDGTEVVLDHGHVAIAAITSCTNTSNPSVMVAAGLVAKKAVEKGLTAKPWVKTSLAPGSKVVSDYLTMRAS